MGKNIHLLAEVDDDVVSWTVTSSNPERRLGADEADGFFLAETPGFRLVRCGVPDACCKERRVSGKEGDDDDEDGSPVGLELLLSSTAVCDRALNL